MRTVKLLKRSEAGQAGEIVEVTNNVAFGLIDSGLAKLYESPKNKMLRPELASGKGYKVK